IAEYLAYTTRARLVLIGRTALPPREVWDQWLADHDVEDRTSCRLRKVRKIETMATEIVIANADVTNREQMRGVVERTYERWGTIHGVIHAAGIAGGVL